MKNQVNQKISKYLKKNKIILAENIARDLYKKQNRLWDDYCSHDQELSIRDIGYHLDFLIESIELSDQSVFNNYVLWAKELFENLNFPDEVMIETLKSTQSIIETEVPPEWSALINQYITSGLKQMEITIKKEPTFIQKENPLAELTNNYLNALLAGKRDKASDLIMNAVEIGTPIKDIYLRVFQQSQYEVGRLWMNNKINVAQEHYCSAATQLIISQLYPKIFTTDKKGLTFVGTCVGGELHEIGIRMVSDFFELEGWDTYYLGANTPTDTIIETVNNLDPDVLGISVTMTFHVNTAKNLIRRIRESQTGESLKILLGGYPFKLIPDLWERFNADGFATNAEQAVNLAEKLVNV